MGQDTDNQLSELPMSDDQELAKALAGLGNDNNAPAANTSDGDNTDESATDDSTMPDPIAAADDDGNHKTELEEAEEMVADSVADTPPARSTTTAVSGDLATVKQQAIEELRPLVDKLAIPAEDKFDTYLLLLRSTDDRDLIAPAHQTALQIEDETRRAQALLDIIKEIDFFSQK